MTKISLHICPHHGFKSVSIDEDELGGTRITPTKCCGSWKRIKSWEMSIDDWKLVINCSQRAIDKLTNTENQEKYLLDSKIGMRAKDKKIKLKNNN